MAHKYVRSHGIGNVSEWPGKKFHSKGDQQLHSKWEIKQILPASLYLYRRKMTR